MSERDPASFPPDSASHVERSASPSPSCEPARILVAEDNPANRLILERILAAAGFALEFAQNGDEARALIESQVFDLVVMDVMMPGAGGIDTTRSVRTSERARGVTPVPIVALTAHGRDENRLACLEAGMNDFLTKPVRRETLLRAVEQWLDRRPFVLVVTQDDALLLEAVRTLEDAARVRGIPSLERALELLARRRPRAIVVDLQLSGADGGDVVQAFRATLCGGPLVAISPAGASLAPGHGFDTILSRPLDANALTGSILQQRSDPRQA